MTVEPFTSPVLAANVNRVSPLCGIHQEPTLLARGRDTVSALRRPRLPALVGPGRLVLDFEFFSGASR